MWIAILVSVLLIAAPVHADTIVDVQAQVDVDELAVDEIALPVTHPPTPAVLAFHTHATPSPAPARGRVFRPPRLAFA